MLNLLKCKKNKDVNNSCRSNVIKLRLGAIIASLEVFFDTVLLI